MGEQLLNVQEVACLVGCSVFTINCWYKYKREHPDTKYAKMLPNFIQDGGRQTRYWRREDLWKIIEFKSSIPKGRYGGVLAETTQKYYKKGKNYGKTKTNKRGKAI